MSSHPENDPEEPAPFQGQVRHSNVSARVPEEVGAGVFANGILLLTGMHELVLDFLLRLGEPHRVVARVILPLAVARQMIHALQENLKSYEDRFGAPGMPRYRPPSPSASAAAPAEAVSEGLSESAPEGGTIPGVSESLHPENVPAPPPGPPSIDEIYGDLRIPDTLLSGRYANAVLIRHSPTEFSFDFITNIYPRSAVSARVHMAVPNVPGMLHSLIRSMSVPPTQP